MNDDLKDIIVIDDVLNPQYADHIEADIFYNRAISLFFNHDVAKGRHEKKVSDGQYGFGINLDHHIFAPLLYDAAEKAGYKVNDLLETRVFMTLPNSNVTTHGLPHIDSDISHKVCLYYVNDVDGDTCFFDNANGDNIVKRVTPKKNRAVIFPGELYHAPFWPTTGPRAIINMMWLGDSYKLLKGE